MLRHCVIISISGFDQRRKRRMISFQNGTVAGEHYTVVCTYVPLINRRLRQFYSLIQNKGIAICRGTRFRLVALVMISATAIRMHAHAYSLLRFKREVLRAGNYGESFNHVLPLVMHSIRRAPAHATTPPRISRRRAVAETTRGTCATLARFNGILSRSPPCRIVQNFEISSRQEPGMPIFGIVP